MGINLGMVFGSAMSTGVQTYGQLQQIQQAAATFQQQQQQWDREAQERQAAATPTSNTQTVTPAMLAGQMQGADGKADGDAVMSTYGATQDPTQAPSQSARIVQQGIAQGQAANAAAGQGPAPITIAQPTPTPAQPTSPAGIAPTAGNAPASFNQPSGDNVQTATQYVMGQEGGYVANDNGKGPTNYGINGQANGLTPEQVKNLTPEQAAQMYQSKYFNGANGGIDISKLPTTTAVAVADTEANMGQATAAKLFEQSGGDINKFLDLRQQAYNKIDAPQTTKDAWNQRMASLREFVNQHGGTETGTMDGSAPPVAPDTKVTLLKATPLTSIGIGQNVKFSHGEDGSLQMTKGDTPADALQRMANKAMQVGDIKNGPQLQSMAIQMRAQEAQSQVSSILTNENMDQDQKVAQLAKIAGAQAYKTENGGYVIPGLGPTDRAGNPLPMNMAQVGNLASSLATPDGLHHVIDTQIAMQKLAQGDRTNDIDQQKVNQQGQVNAADANYKGEVAKYYGANAKALADNRNAQAAERQGKADIDTELRQLQDKMNALDPNAPDYKQQVQHLNDVANLVKMRGGIGSTTSQKVEKPEIMQDGQTRQYADGSTRTFLSAVGREVPSSDAPSIVAGLHEIQSNPAKYMAGDGSAMVKPLAGPDGHWGFALNPNSATKAGLDPNTLYATPQAAHDALYRNAKAAGALVGMNPQPSAVMPQVGIGNNPVAAIP